MSKRSTLEAKRKQAITKKMEDLVHDILSGTKIENVKIPITLTIPRHLYDTYKEVSKQYNLPLEEALAQLANQGIQRALAIGNFQQATNDKPLDDSKQFKDILKDVGLDTTALDEGLNKLQELAKAMQQMENTFNDEPTNKHS